MNSNTTSRSVKYIATVSNVQDITLVGLADYAYWTDQLAGEKLAPLNANGRAEIWICAARLRWMGVGFAELSVSIRVGDEGRDAYLIGAFNTSRMFAFCERTFFHTPYQHAIVSVDAALKSFSLQDGSAIAIRATRAPATAITNFGDSWEGRIFLPSDGREKGKRQFFCARLCGTSEVSPFNLSSDACTFAATSNSSVVQQLIGSEFRGAEWRVRTSATHARSKTYAAG